jgi:hypothetical protein
LSWGVEYKIAGSETKGEKKIYNKVREKWGIENEGEETRENNYWPEEEFPEGNVTTYVFPNVLCNSTFTLAYRDLNHSPQVDYEYSGDYFLDFDNGYVFMISAPATSGDYTIPIE